MITAGRQKAAGTRYRFRVHDYHRMGEAGILTEDDHVELIDGDLIEMPPIGSRHAECVDRLNAMLSEQLHGKYRIRVQNLLELGEYGEPEPDLVIVENRSYVEAHPQAKDVRLLIEVADPSATYGVTLSCPFMPGIGSMRSGSLRSRPNQSRSIENPPGKDTDIFCGPLAMR